MTNTPPNLPWVESPFFRQELAGRPTLTAAEIELVTHYHTHGYATLPGVVGDDLVDRIKTEVQGLFRPEIQEGWASYYRVHDAWTTSPAVKELALDEKILAALRLLYGRAPVPFQTLNFLYGSQQANHSDAILFNSLPARYMCGVWVALEDVDLESGPLFYYPSSHRLKEYSVQDFRDPGGNPDGFFGERYPQFISQLMATEGFQREQLRVKKGSALIWASNLVHGGMPRLDKSLTRWTQVTHYFFEDCIYYVPLYSNTIAGELCLRDVTDLRTGGPVAQTYNGRKFLRTRTSEQRWRVEFLDEQASVRREVPSPNADSSAGPGRIAGFFSPTRLLARLRPSVVSRQETPGLLFHVDGFEDGPGGVSVFGWAFLPDDPGGTLQVVLESEKNSYVVDCQKLKRPDVNVAFPKSPPEAGFQVFIDKRPLASGVYRVGLLLRNESCGQVFRRIDHTVRVSPS
ncbi:MAG: phytanoyl-CoA dioxygenase family protein [Thermoanaerobaculia bacterium]